MRARARIVTWHIHLFHLFTCILMGVAWLPVMAQDTETLAFGGLRYEVLDSLAFNACAAQQPHR
jgi:hypothetical protein